MADFESMMEGDGFSDMEDWLDHIQEKADRDGARLDAEAESNAYSSASLRNENILRKQLLYYLQACNKQGCTGQLVLKITKSPHHYFWSCTGYPVCRCTDNFYQNQILDAKCKTCGSNLIIKFGSKGAFVGCTNYPNCKFTDDLPFKDRIAQDKYVIKINDVNCKLE